MTDMIPLAFEENLVRAVQRDGAPWFAGKDVCECLGISKHHQALDELDPDERGTCTIPTPRGDQAMIVISEPGVYRLVFRSRKPEAERFKRWLAHDVLPKLRRGELVEPELPDGEPPAIRISGDITREPLMHRVHLLRAAHAVYGRAVAQKLWHRLGLPDVPPPPMTGEDEARQCLRHILEAPVHASGPSVRETIERALDDDMEAQALLLTTGIKALPERDAFVIANDHPWLRRLMHGTEWSHTHAHMRVLRRLPGISAGDRYRVGPMQKRGTLLPARYLDDR